MAKFKPGDIVEFVQSATIDETGEAVNIGDTGIIIYIAGKDRIGIAHAQSDGLSVRVLPDAIRLVESIDFAPTYDAMLDEDGSLNKTGLYIRWLEYQMKGILADRKYIKDQYDSLQQSIRELKE